MKIPLIRLVPLHKRITNNVEAQNYIDKIADAYTQGQYVPPIVIEEDGTLIDGYYRMLARKRAGFQDIEYESR